MPIVLRSPSVSSAGFGGGSVEVDDSSVSVTVAAVVDVAASVVVDDSTTPVSALASTVVGIGISIPIGLGAARNISVLPVYLFCRSIIALSRALNEIVVAILLVAIFGFGPMAGFLTLSFATIGFLSKLLAEEIEDMDKVQAEAVRATGGTWLQRYVFGIHPQVVPRLIGLSMYRLDINFRESAVLGIVGAGGIGATLNTAFDRYEFDTAAAILLVIIGAVMVLEYLSGIIRAKVQ